jgi:hypothetical protein
VRGVRRVSTSALRTPGVELRVRFARPDHPLAHGYPVETSVFRTNLPAYDAPRRWLEAAYCTSCLDGPEDRTGVVLEWAAADGSQVVSGGARGESELAGRPALFDLAVGQGRVVAFNFNPVHRDLNRSDHRLLWNVLLNWQRLLKPGPRPSPHGSRG